MEHIKLGAINKNTNKYTSLYLAEKEHKYLCPDCNKDVILRKGLINRVHFAHTKHSGCNYYDNPSESQIHKDAKMLMKMLIERKKVTLCKKCEHCNIDTEIKFHDYNQSMNILVEHRFKISYCENLGNIYFEENIEIEQKIKKHELNETIIYEIIYTLEEYYDENDNENYKIISINDTNNIIFYVININNINSYNINEEIKYSELELYNKLVIAKNIELIEFTEYEQSYYNHLRAGCLYKFKIADIAYLHENKQLKAIFEIFYTHKTDERERPEPWFEINAVELLQLNINNEIIKINCTRNYICEECINKKYIELKNMNIIDLIKNETNLEWYIRYELGQRIFFNNNYHKQPHLRFSTNSDKHNIMILNLFKNFYKNKKPIIIISKFDYYFHFININENEETYNKKLSVRLIEDLQANPNIMFILNYSGTVEIIKYILKNINREYIIINNNMILKNTTCEDIIRNRIYLNINFNDKEYIKTKNGKWDTILKKWYINNKNKYKKEILEKYDYVNLYLE